MVGTCAVLCLHETAQLLVARVGGRRWQYTRQVGVKVLQGAKDEWIRSRRAVLGILLLKLEAALHVQREVCALLVSLGTVVEVDRQLVRLFLEILQLVSGGGAHLGELGAQDTEEV